MQYIFPIGGWEPLEDVNISTLLLQDLEAPLPFAAIPSVSCRDFCVFRNRRGGRRGTDGHMELWYISGCFRWQDDGGHELHHN